MNPLEEAMREFEFPFSMGDVEEYRVARELSHGVQLEVTTDCASYIVEIQDGQWMEIGRVFITECNWKQLKRKTGVSNEY